MHWDVKGAEAGKNEENRWEHGLRVEQGRRPLEYEGHLQVLYFKTLETQRGAVDHDALGCHGLAVQTLLEEALYLPVANRISSDSFVQYPRRLGPYDGKSLRGKNQWRRADLLATYTHSFCPVERKFGM